MSMNTDIVVVGGGPIGLWTAIQAKIRNPRLKISVFEKYHVYKRSHNLLIDPASLDGTPNHYLLNKIVEEFRKKKTVPTNGIEDKLKELADQLGIQTHYQEVTDPKRLMKQFPGARVFIGADGAHSIVHKKIFKNAFAHSQDMQYIAEIKYFIKGSGRKLKLLTEAYKTSKLAGAVVTEHVGHVNAQGRTAVTMRIFIDRKTYEQMKEASFKSPYTFSKNLSKIQPELRKKMQIWLNAKTLLAHEKRVKDSEKITVTKLAVYSSRSYVKDEKYRKWCLVGDAAFGVPFFRSLNCGLISGTKLAACISKAFPQDHSLPRLDILNSYNTSIWWLSSYEILKAKLKNFLLNVLHYYTLAAGHSPIAVTKWSYSQAQQLRSRELV